LHHKSLDAEADLLAGAFAVNQPSEAQQLLLTALDDEADGHQPSSGDQE
jgi:hypothetical protein